MKLWRLVRQPFLDLDGAGQQAIGGRWTSPGAPVVSFASEPGLAVLVVIRYLPRDLKGIDQDYCLGWTETDIVPEDLPFVEDANEKRRIGDDWLLSGRTLLAQVQSAVLPEASVIMMNPLHPDANSIAPLEVRRFDFEACLNLPAFPAIPPAT